MKQQLAITVFAAILGVATCHSYMISEEFVRSINKKATTWTTKRNFENYTTEQLKTLAGVRGISRDPNFTLPIKVHNLRNAVIPDSFDAREIWPECESIKTIRDQGHCGSCWAFAAAEVMSDRLCISTAGNKKFTFSPEELISCCSYCGMGCEGGYLYEPFRYWTDNGIPSGGDYGSNLGCRPYTAVDGQTPSCEKQCVSGYPKAYNDDLRHGISAYHVSHHTKQMQREIMKSGPVEALMEVYEDFFSYGGGVYQHSFGFLLGRHAIKIIGWGSDEGIPYWLVANSWGTDFGEDGFFRILRGSNHCNIESFVTAGIPNTSE